MHLSCLISVQMKLANVTLQLTVPANPSTLYARRSVKMMSAELVTCCRFEEPSEVAERLHIKVVPSFYFYKNSTIVEQFATRDKHKIAAAINKHVGYDVV